MTDEGTEKFIEYLDNLQQLCDMFKSIAMSCEITSELPLTDEQVELANVLLNKLQNDWSDTFLAMLEYGMKWIEHNKELDYK